MVMIAAWEGVKVNAGYGTEGFSVDQTNLKWSEKDGFGGWLGESHFVIYISGLYNTDLTSLRLEPQRSPAILPLRTPAQKRQDPLELQQGRPEDGVHLILSLLHKGDARSSRCHGALDMIMDGHV